MTERYSLEIEASCEEEIRKKCRKNRPMQEALEGKIEQVLQMPYHFKPLRKPLEGTRSVHVLGSFVLVYDIIEGRKTVRLLRFRHHDEAYEF